MSEESRKLLAFLSVRRNSPRKLRLLVCAYRRHGIHRPADGNSPQSIELAERYADGELLVGDALVSGDPGALASAAVTSADGGNSHHLACLIRDIFVNPFRPLPPPSRTAARLWQQELDSALRWNSGVIADVARAAYEERILPAGTLQLDRLAVLADALEEVGCINPEILGHLRSPGPHVRGCWPVDLISGRLS